MGYKRIRCPEGFVYHYTRRENLEGIRRDGCLHRFGDKECWVCNSLEHTLRLMELTVMQEGKLYYVKGGIRKRYPPFVPEDYVILKLEPRYQNGDWVIWRQEMPSGTSREVLELADEFSRLKLGFRGDLKFRGEPEVFELVPLLETQVSIQEPSLCLSMQTSCQ